MQISRSHSSELKKELKDLKESKLPKAQKELKDAIAEGDWLHDNVLWQRAHENMNRRINRIREIEEILRKAEVVGK